jgi:hypothetical protein
MKTCKSKTLVLVLCYERREEEKYIYTQVEVPDGLRLSEKFIFSLSEVEHG